MLQRSRILAITTLTAVLALFLALEVRLFFLQVVNKTKYEDYKKRVSRHKKTTPFSRGEICDAHGAPLALSVPQLDVFIDSRHVDRKYTKENDAFETAKTLARILDLDHAKVRAKFLSKDGPCWRCIKKGVTDPDTILNLFAHKEGRKLYGVHLIKGFKRKYPHNELLGHLIGWVNYEGDGVFGVEALYNNFLKGRDGLNKVMRDGVCNEIFTRDKGVVSGMPGGRVTLTIDSAIQLFAEIELAKASQKYDPKWCCAVVLAPKTGRVLAAASWPGLNPSQPFQEREDHWMNRPFSAVYIPGSTFKPIAMAMAHDRGVVHPTESIDCENGRWRYKGRPVADVHKNYTVLTPPEVLINSSNVGMSKIILRLVPEGTPKGSDAFKPVLDKLFMLGLGKASGILPRGQESDGMLTPISKWTRKYTLMSISFGNEMAVTPIQMVSAFATLANGGLYHPPRVVDSITFPDGRKKAPLLRPGRRVFSKRTADLVRNWLVRVVEEGSGKKCRIPGVKVGGKTGTSEKLPEKIEVTASFIAFAPAQDPELVALVVVDEPKGEHYASQVAAPYVKNILEKSLYHLGVCLAPKNKTMNNKKKES